MLADRLLYVDDGEAAPRAVQDRGCGRCPATTFLRSWQDLEIVTLFTLPMFLFSGTFYGLNANPLWLRIVVECLPLHHGVALMRGLSVGDRTRRWPATCCTSRSWPASGCGSPAAGWTSS